MTEHQSDRSNNPETPAEVEKLTYTKPEIVSEPLFESAALGAGKLIDQFPVICSEISES